jgi:calcium/calmodulin-dependent protein kinase I
VTDLALGGELFHRICRQGPYCESDAVARIGVILSAVAYIHDQNIVHRDLKPENILFRTFQDDTDLVIADFGDSCIIDERSRPLTSLCGTLGYMAPEMITRSGHGKSVYVLLNRLY